ncbi:MAG: hypothetical protein L3K05_00290 [Thermoplasmata archaeon]|nr:hypothetical protein [Thermoplasmata archaeon]
MSGPYGGAQPPSPFAPPPPSGIAPVGPPIMGPPAGWAYGPSVPELLGRVNEGVRWYLIVLILQFLGAAASAAVSGYVLGGGAFAAPISGNTNGGAFASVLLLGLGLAIFGVLAFVLTIVAWVKWRSGVRALPDAAPSMGAAYLESARLAARSYSRTIYAFIAEIVSSIALAIGITALIVAETLGSLPNCSGGNRTVPCSSTGSVSIPNSEIQAAIVVGGLVFELFAFLVYYFASTSLVAALAPLASPAQQEELHQGRLAVLLGAALLPLGLVAEVVGYVGPQIPALGFLGLVSPALLLYGMYRIHGAYSGWCDAHPPPPMGYAGPWAAPAPSYSPGTPYGYAPPTGVPYAPPPPPR